MKIKIIDYSSEVSQRATALELLEKQIDSKLAKCDQLTIFNVALKRREEISKRIMSDVWSYISEIQNWHALCYLLEKCNILLLNGNKSGEIFEELAALSKEITLIKNEIGKLQKHQALIIEIEGKKDRHLAILTCIN